MTGNRIQYTILPIDDVISSLSHPPIRRQRQTILRHHHFSNSIQNLLWFTFILFLLFLLLCSAQTDVIMNVTTTSVDDNISDNNNNNNNEFIATAPPRYAVLFPWFIQVIGVITFFIITKYEIIIPFQAIMFIIGAISGIVTTIRYNAIDPTSSSSSSSSSIVDELDQLSISILQWSTINGAVLLLVFLPGLIFRDAIEVNFNLFYKALPQLLLLAFPLVLVGSAMTAGVGKYVLSYFNNDWPLSLWMVLGSILSSTDPIAVGSLLKKAKAPSRLQMHIGGESLINDGSALVFYIIFTKQYISDLNLGESVTFGEGIILFLRMAVGGFTVGIVFALGLCYLLHVMDTRLEPEYNIVQVVAALSIAYISYYVAEQVCNMSGIIACVVCGIAVRAIGKGLIRDHQLMDSYLALMEHLLNTLLFALGGVVWGKAVANGSLRALDWLYLIVFYAFVMIIRFVQMGLFYPVFSRIGLKSDWKEALFLAYGGIRGGIGIALALALKGSVLPLTDEPEVERALSLLEFLAGGVTLLTLLVNGTTAGPMLRRLGLSKPLVSRKQAIKLFESSAESFVNEQYAEIVSQERFARTRFRAVKAHVPFLSKAPKRQRKMDGNESEQPDSRTAESQRTGMSAIESNRSLISNNSDQTESQRNVNSERKWISNRKAKQNIRQLSAPNIGSDFFTKEDIDEDKEDADPIRTSEHMTRVLSVRTLGANEQLVEIRQFFLELVDQAYCDELQLGELDQLDENDGLNADLLRQSVAFASTDVDHRQPIHDWDYAKYNMEEVVSMAHWMDYFMESKEDRIRAQQYQHRRNNVLRCLAFMEAHQRAETRLKALLSSAGSSDDPVVTGGRPSSHPTLKDIVEDVELNNHPKNAQPSRGSFEDAISTVLKESKQQVKKAKALLSDIPNPEIQRITSHYVCTILLHRLITYVQQNTKDGLLSKKEGMLYLKQIDRNLYQSYTCTHGHTDGSDINELLRQQSNHHNPHSRYNTASSIRSINGGVSKPTSKSTTTNPTTPTMDASDRVTAVMGAYLYKK